MRRGPTTLAACFDRAAQAALPAASLPPAWPPAWRRQPGRTPPARPAGPSQAASTAQEPEEPSPLRRSEEQARLEAALFLTREPLATRKLAKLARLSDGTRARALIRELNAAFDAKTLQSLLTPFHANLMEIIAVSQEINYAKNDRMECLQRTVPQETQPLLFPE